MVAAAVYSQNTAVVYSENTAVPRRLGPENNIHSLTKAYQKKVQTNFNPFKQNKRYRKSMFIKRSESKNTS